MTHPTYNVLFICTRNSGRSILAEALMNELGSAKGFRAYSGGSMPHGGIHPLALKTLQDHHLSTDGLHSKDWHTYTGADAPEMDFVFTVCDEAAGEVCPVWPGQPLTAHWGQPDPAAFEGNESAQAHAFLTAFVTIKRRIELMLALPMAQLDRLAIHHHITEIAQR
ncbi:MAG: arsenate reductase ArsC [Leptothrix sp. (in: b-proteobacteria)]